MSKVKYSFNNRWKTGNFDLVVKTGNKEETIFRTWKAQPQP